MKFNMKHASILMAAILNLSLVSCKDDDSSPEPSPEKPTEVGLVSYYDFQHNADDRFGSNDGVEYNTEYLENTPKELNTVLALNGENSYVNLQTPFDLEEMTISVWFNVLTINPSFDLIYTSDHPGLAYGLLSIATRNDDGVDNLYFDVSGQNVTAEIETNEWYHVVIIRNKKEYKYYLNNVLVKAGTFDNYLTSAAGTSTAIVGAVRTLAGGYFHGYIDNLRIYSRALTEDEIDVLYKE